MRMWKVGALAIAVGGAALVVPRSQAHAQRCPTCAPEDTARRTHVSPALGIHVGMPQKASVALGIVVGEEWQQDAHDHSRNIAVFAEPGLSGGRASVAYVDKGYGSFGSGFGLAATALRTWKDPWGAKENVTYAGGEVILWPILFIGPRIGLFRSVAGTVGSKKWLVSIDFGIGL